MDNPTVELPAEPDVNSGVPASAVLLQVSHRLAVVALLATLGTLAAVFLGADFHLPLATASATALVGACLAAIAVMHRPRLALQLTLLGAGAMGALRIMFEPQLVLAIGVVFAALIACAAVGLWTNEGRPPTAWRESVGVLRFNAVLAVVALLMMLVARLDVMHADVERIGGDARAAVRAFFTPPPTMPRDER